MLTFVQKIRIFVASPSDVAEERLLLETVVQELNRSVGDEKGIVLDLIRWETHVAPGMGRPQEVVNQQVGEHDIFVGIMWKRFGTPTGEAGSGTEEEFQRAYSAWENTGSPRIMFYFRQDLYTIKTQDEAVQIGKVLAFRSEIQSKGITGEYTGPREFERIVRQHLQTAVRAIIGTSANEGSSKQQSAADTDKTPTLQRDLHQPKIVDARESLWHSVLDYRSLWEEYLVVHKILLPEEFSGVFSSHPSSGLISGLSTKDFYRKLDRCARGRSEVEKKRMYLDEELWSLYYSYTTFAARQSFKVANGVESHHIPEWDKDLSGGPDTGFLDIVRQVLPANKLDPILQDSVSTERHARRLAVPQRILMVLEQEIISRIKARADA